MNDHAGDHFQIAKKMSFDKSKFKNGLFIWYTNRSKRNQKVDIDVAGLKIDASKVQGLL